MNPVELLPVQLWNVPVELWSASRRWFDELLREFAVIATSSPDADVPRQLLDFVDDVQKRFSRFSESTNLELENANNAGLEYVDLRLELPAEAGPVALDLYDHLLRADKFCREGHFLTIEASESVKRFLKWYLSEVTHQLGGAEPTPWDVSET